MILAFDTDTFSLLLRGHPRVAARYRESVAADEHGYGVPAVVRIELLEGRFARVTKAADGGELLLAYDLLVRTEAAIATYPILPVTQAVGDHYSRFRRDKKFKKMGAKDLLIACIALAHNAALVTRNTKDFASVPGLKLENWAD